MAEQPTMIHLALDLILITVLLGGLAAFIIGRPKR
jgi:hypothetical protein